jgi:hypothetical protein
LHRYRYGGLCHHCVLLCPTRGQPESPRRYQSQYAEKDQPSHADGNEHKGTIRSPYPSIRFRLKWTPQGAFAKGQAIVV